MLKNNFVENLEKLYFPLTETARIDHFNRNEQVKSNFFLEK